jgi:hypothetical protein
LGDRVRGAPGFCGRGSYSHDLGPLSTRAGSLPWRYGEVSSLPAERTSGSRTGWRCRPGQTPQVPLPGW